MKLSDTLQKGSKRGKLLPPHTHTYTYTYTQGNLKE